MGLLYLYIYLYLLHLRHTEEGKNIFSHFLNLLLDDIKTRIFSTTSIDKPVTPSGWGCVGSETFLGSPEKKKSPPKTVIEP
jgi:hypothetical protein